MDEVDSTNRELNGELLKACDEGLTEKVEHLLDAGADAEARSEEGDTVLIRACHRGHLEVVRLLIERGVDVNITEAGGVVTPLMRAKDSEIAKLLVSHGALWDLRWQARTNMLKEFLNWGTFQYGSLYFAPEVAMRAIRRCQELNLAVYGMDGFELAEGATCQRPDLIGDFSRSLRKSTWIEARDECNRNALAFIAFTIWFDSLNFEFVMKSEEKWLDDRERYGWEATKTDKTFSSAADRLTPSLRDIRTLAGQGQPEFQIQLAWCYFHGGRVEQSYEEAMNWFLKAARQGDSDAQFWTGLCYANGIGVPRDFQKAEKWLLKSGGRTHRGALWALAEVHEQGIPTTQLV